MRLLENFLQVKDVNKMNNFIKRYSDMEIDIEFLEQAVCIDYINNENLDLMNKYLYVSETLDAPNYAQLNTEFNKYDFGIAPTIEVECNKCKGVSSTGLVFREEFFIPKYRV